MSSGYIFIFSFGLRVVGKGSWTKSRNWKVLSWKVRYEIGQIDVGKFGLKLQSSRRSWKVPAEVGKYNSSCKVTEEVRKF